MAFNEQEQEIIRAGVSMGKTREETEEALLRYRSGLGPVKEIPKKVIVSPGAQFPSPTIEDVKSSYLYKGAEKVSERIKKGGERYEEEPTLTGKTAELGSALKGVTAETLKTAFTPIGVGIEKGIDVVSDIKAVQDFASNEKVGKFLDVASNIMGTIFQKWEDISKNNPRLAEELADNAEILLTVIGEKPVQSAIGRVADTADDIAKRALKTSGEIASKGRKVISSTIDDVSRAFKSSYDDIVKGTKTVSDVLTDTKRYISRANVPENLGSSVERLATKTVKTPTGETIKYNPLQKYNEFLDQEMKFKADIRQDMAAGKVGEKIGNAFDDVIKKRREIGATMESEIKKIGNIMTPIDDAFPKLETELLENGLTYQEGKLIPTRTSKVTSQDIGLLEEYVANLNQLGAKPTAVELDAFLSKIPKELDVFKAKNNITKVTNGERIVNNHLRELRSNLSPENNPIFADYFKSRSDYAELTKFLDEGSSFLGKKTQAGDYAKDASVVKSSVQSILNQGKKDWLIKLEDLTGYPALDEAVLALQAMKDAGNPMGHSLLELVTKGSLPTTPKGVAEKVLDVGLEYGKSKFVGTPSEQTQRIIQEMMGRANTPKINMQKGSFNPKAMADDILGKSDDLITEARKYDNGKDFYELSGAKINQELRDRGIRGQEQVTKFWEEITGKKSVNNYRMSHRPQEMGSGFNIDEMGNAPRFYENPNLYKHTKNEAYDESIDALLKIKGKPEATVTVYRASPKAELNDGDWISLSKKYAEGEAKTEGVKVQSFKVKAKDIQFAGDDINEFGYFPKK